jgi:hypothetical protein
MGENLKQVYAEKLELVYREYAHSLDLDIALTVVPLTPGERAKLLEDDELAARIALLDARNRGEMVDMLRKIGRSSESDGIRLAALKELGKTYYPKRFRDTGDASASIPRKILYELVEPAE